MQKLYAHPRPAQFDPAEHRKGLNYWAFGAKLLSVESIGDPITVAPMLSRFFSRGSSRTQRPLFSRVGAAVLLGVVLSASVACNKKDGATEEKKEEQSKEQEKIARLEALLKENGVDPSTVPAASAAPSDPAAPAAKTPGSTPDGAPGAPGQGLAPKEKVEILSKGNAPLAPLRYSFEQGRSRNFSLDISIDVKRSVAGQPAQGSPAISIALVGKAKTLSVENGSAKRENTFIKITPSVTGLPPEILGQFQAQYDALSGLQMIETVSDRGVVTGLQVDQRAIHPQVLALMQQLQDGMTNAYLALPEEPVGVGARWITRTESDAGGIVILQENEVLVKSLKGSKAEIELTFRQKAKSTKITGAELPPGVEMEVTRVDGSGTGTMTVDFKELLISSNITLNTLVDATIKEPSSPAPIKQSSDTTVKAKVTYTK